MSNPPAPIAVTALEAPLRSRPSNHPEPFASRMTGREKRPLGDLKALLRDGRWIFLDADGTPCP